jgi:multiple sugar transport system permease protein
MISLARRIQRVATVVLILLWSLFPMYWALKTSLSTLSAAEGRPPQYIPSPFVTDNYKSLLGLGQSNSDISYQFTRSLINSTIESGGAAILTLVVATLAAYAFARLDLKFKRVIFVGVLGTLLLPAYATLLPLYRLMSDWGLVNTYVAVIAIYSGGFLPLAVWILYNYFQSPPSEIEEAAKVDGASMMQTLIKVVLPLSAPGVAAAGLITFLLGWTQFLFPLVLTSDLSTQPLTVIVTALNGQRVVPYTLMMGLAVLAAAPPGLIALAVNRRMVEGLTAGSAK